MDCLKREHDLTDVKIMMMLIQEAFAAKWKKYDERLQKFITNFHEFSTVTNHLKYFSDLI